MLEFEKIGQKRLEDAASAVHQRQCSSYAPETPPNRASQNHAIPIHQDQETHADKADVVDIPLEARVSKQDLETHMDEVDVDILLEARVSKLAAIKPMTTGDWAVMMKKVESYPNERA